MSAFIPRELIKKILLELTVKALIRFKSLSKSWYSIIDGKASIRIPVPEPDFIKIHLDHSMTSKTNLHVIFTHLGISPPANIQTIPFDDEEESTISTTLCNPLKQCVEKTEILASCNGVLCLHDDTTRHCRLVFWNPFTRKYKVLDTLEYRDHGQPSFGFSFDEANGDYKVVRILVSDDPQQHPSEVNVYSLKLTSWRRINDFPFNGYSLEGVGCFVDGGLNWLASNLSKSLSVVSYNLELEEFNEKAIPVSVHRDEDCKVDLQAMDGKLCLLEVYHPISIDIWVLGNHWMKMYSLLENGVLTNLMDIKLLSCSKNGERILLSDNRDLIWYDLQDNTSKRVTVRGFPPHPHFDAHMCFESLVSLGDDSLFDGN